MKWLINIHVTASRYPKLFLSITVDRREILSSTIFYVLSTELRKRNIHV